MHPQPGDEADQQVRGAGRPSPQDAFAPVVTPAAHQVVAFFDLVQEERQILREVLQVGIHRDDEIAARGGQAGLQRGGLSEVAPQFDDAETGLGRDQRLGDVERSIRAAVVDEDELEAIAPLESSDRGGETGREFSERRRLVVDGRDDADEHHGRVPITVQL